MHAFLITGKTKEVRDADIAKRIEAWKIGPWDIIRIPFDEEGAGSVGIEKIREFQKQLFLTPQQSQVKVGVIDTIERLTAEAQNALLKMLEEPPPHTYLLAETDIPDKLLPTILSRFSLISLGQDEKTRDEDAEKLLGQLLKASPGQIINLLEPCVATRDEAKILVNKFIYAARNALLVDPTNTKLVATIRALFTAEWQLAVNVNQRLVLEHIFLLAGSDL